MNLRKVHNSYTCSNKQSQERKPESEGKIEAWGVVGVGQESDYKATNGPGHIQGTPRPSPGQVEGDVLSCKSVRKSFRY
jgi:hypothetical protein